MSTNIDSKHEPLTLDRRVIQSRLKNTVVYNWGSTNSSIVVNDILQEGIVD